MSYVRVQPPMLACVNDGSVPETFRRQLLSDWTALLQYIEQSGSRDTRVVSGMAVTNTSGLTYAVAAGTYTISGQAVTFAGGSITLDAASSTPRIDIITIDRDGVLGKVKGTAALNPSTPAVLDQTVLALSSIYVQPSTAWFPAVNVSGTLSAAQIAVASLDATKMNLKTILIIGLTLTSNSPTAGKIAWSACTVYWNGSAYSVSSGSTSATTNKFVTWTVAGGTFAGQDSYTPSDTVLLIATNTGGTAAEAWNRGGAALSAIQRSNMSFALLEGFSVQDPAKSIVGNIVFTWNGPAALAGNLLTVNQSVVLISVRIIVDTPYTVNAGAGGPVTSKDLYLRITCDGATAQTIKIIDTITTLIGGGVTAPVDFNEAVLCYQTNIAGTGGHTAGDWVAVQFGISCLNSLVIDLYAVNSDPSINNSLTMAGQMRISIGYALKV